MNQHSRTVSVVAGPKGAGKSTFVENYLNRYVDCDEFVNADLIYLEHHSLSMDEKVDAACRDAGHQVIELAEQTGTEVVIWRDGDCSSNRYRCAC